MLKAATHETTPRTHTAAAVVVTTTRNRRSISLWKLVVSRKMASVVVILVICGVSLLMNQKYMINNNNNNNNNKREEKGHNQNLDLSQLLLQRFHIRNSSASEMAYLHHCDLHQVDVAAFFEWQSLIFTQLVPNLRSKWSNTTDVAQRWRNTPQGQQEYDELTLQALEMFAVAANVCNFSFYNFSIPRQQPHHNLLEQKVARIPLPVNRTDQARLVFLLSIYSDFPHLKHLIHSLHLPHHLVVIHLDRQTPEEFRNQAQALADSYPNVVLLQFGEIVYTTDTITQVFLRIFRWVTMDLQFDYDYLVTASATSFPLWTAQEMAHKLAIEPRRVRIGRIHYGNGRNLCYRTALSRGLFLGNMLAMATHYNSLNQIAVARNSSAKYDIFGNELAAFRLPNQLQLHCNAKVVSGNTAAWDVDAVRALLNNPGAMQLLAYFKYSGNCAPEELHYSGVLNLIGRSQDLDENKHGAMWQSWQCRSAMKNVLLEYDPNACIHLFLGTTNYKVVGIEAMKQELFLARTERGNLMARKFGTANMIWKEWIQSNLHNLEEKIGSSHITWQEFNKSTFLINHIFENGKL